MPRFPRWQDADEIDRQARRLYEMLLESDDAGPTRDQQVVRPEPVHPLIVQAQRWRHAIYTHDAFAAQKAAEALATLMDSGYGRRPIMAALYERLQPHNQLSQENLPALVALVKVVRG